MLILAPMQGLTELLFRKVYHDTFPGALDSAVSPFLSLTHGNLETAWKKIEDVLPQLNVDSIPVVPQILGREPEEFVALANRLHEVGYDEVNWNIGCPMRRVAGKHRGSGILPYPDEVKFVLDNVVPHLHLKLSVKMRLGYYNREEIFNLIPILNDYPLKSVTIHPRIGKQVYSGQVDLDTFEKVLPNLHHHVVYNGDIHSISDYRKIRKRFPQITDFMLGRGILRNPSLPYQIRDWESGKNERDYTQQVRQLMLNLIQAIDNRPVSSEAKVRKTKEYWCLMGDAFGITEMQKKSVLHRPNFEETRFAILDIIQ